MLSIERSLAVWSRVYYYGIVGTAVGMAFFASPASRMLSQRLTARMERPELARAKSDSGDQVMLGVPVDAEAELQEIVTEVRSELERARRDGVQVPDVRALVREKLAQTISELEQKEGSTSTQAKLQLQEVKKEL